MEQDARFRVFHTENHDVSHVRNFALSKCQGEYIGFVGLDG